MVFDDQVSRVIHDRLFAIGIPCHLIKPLSELMIKWGQSSGEEWFISRMKAIKLHFISGDPVPWMRKNSRGHLAGPFGSLLTWAGKSDRNFSLALQALQAYTLVIHSEITESQVVKFKSAINAPVIHLPHSFHKGFFNFVRRLIGKRDVRRDTDVSLLSYRGSPSRWRPPHSWIISRSPTCKDVLGYLDWFKIPSNLDICHKYKDLFSPVLYGIDSSFIYDIPNGHPSYSSKIDQFQSYETCDVMSLFGGEVHFLQQAGGKLRSIASPHIPFQLALRHLGDSIYQIVKELSWDCTFDQEKATDVVTSHLNCGYRVHSVDLSNATDYFPLSVQETCLRAIFGNIPDIDLFCDISRSHWKSDLGVVRWTQGQPLGLYPSFGLFTLTHGLVLAYLKSLDSSGEDHPGLSFFVLGDDVVIMDEKLYDRYISFLKNSGCPWSKQKSLSSNSIAEFAGKVITRFSSFSCIKWNAISDDNFLDICRLIGPGSRSLLNHRQKFVFDKVKHLLPPLGLNYSYPGSTYQSMFEETERVQGQASLNVVGSLMGLSTVVRKNIYERDRGCAQYRLDEILNTLSTFDEKVISALQSLNLSFGLSHLKGSPSLEGYSGVPSALGCTDLPLVVVKPLGDTTLQRLTRMLSRKRQ